ncbi:MAG: D-alanyl-D-alanine carboxypeptidase family protein [Patescibacteria group bacterium]
MVKFRLQKSDEALTESILRKAGEHQQKHPLFARLGFEKIYKFLSNEEKIFIKKIMGIDPQNYGFRGLRYDLVPVPQKLVVIRNQQYRQKGGLKTLPPQLVPKKVYSAFRKLNEAMEKDISKKLLIESAYRSPAYQLITFLHYLKFHKWDLRRTVKRVALPGYSEHGFPPKQALDFITIDGIPADEKPLEFAKTKEYKWLLRNAKKFNFHLSYPRNNKWGITFEPWHWAFGERKSY